MNRAVQLFVEYTSATLQEALHMASLNPAKAIGLDQQKGSLEVGKDADVLVLDQDLNVQLALWKVPWWQADSKLGKLFFDQIKKSFNFTSALPFVDGSIHGLYDNFHTFFETAFVQWIHYQLSHTLFMP